MISDVVRYIEDAQQKGFALEEIKSHLSKHGWNEFLIDYAVGQIEKRSDRKWLQGSMMAIFLIVLASTGTVWWVNSGASQPSCMIESGQGSWRLISDAKECCSWISRQPCTRVQGLDVRDAKGRTAFSPDVSCRLGQSMVYTSQKVVRDCRSWVQR